MEHGILGSTSLLALPNRIYNAVLADPPWYYYGDPNKSQAAGKHYKQLQDEEIYNIPVKDLLHSRSIVFLWVTSPKLAIGINTLNKWGCYYRGIAFNWIKTREDGVIINGQGGRPSLVKSTTELVLWGSPKQKGRPLPVKDESIAQVLSEWETDTEFAPRPNNIHSKKPEDIQTRIEQLIDGPYIELFARRGRPGWDSWGDQVELNL